MFNFKSQVYLTKNAVIKPFNGTLDHFIFNVTFSSIDEEGDMVNSSAIIILVGQTGVFDNKLNSNHFVKAAHLEFICREVRLATSVDSDIKFYVPYNKADIFII